MNLFIDTNIFLSFYSLSSDDLDQLKNLAVLVRQDQITLLLPIQVTMEFKRNRANKIAEALKGLRDQRLNLQFPQMCKEYPEWEKLRKAQKTYETEHAKLLGNLENDIANRNLKGDSVIEELFQYAQGIDTSAVLLEEARLRTVLGNPPGKIGELGDAIIWEALLKGGPDGEDLHFITDDRHFASALDVGALDPYLLDEWEEKKKSDLHFYRRLSEFLRDEFPDIEIADEIDLDKNLLIERLHHSPNFEETHRVITSLSKYSDFTLDQLNKVCQAVVSNSQVYWIINDIDVRSFLSRIVREHADQLQPEFLERLSGMLSGEIDVEKLPY
ncbi:MAG: DUF4935 domain-containing protein [Chloroflexi bacterium]|nr:DUF4935 domain-containing protein [Chloroflexota bacterium]